MPVCVDVILNLKAILSVEKRLSRALGRDSEGRCQEQGIERPAGSDRPRDRVNRRTQHWRHHTEKDRGTSTREWAGGKATAGEETSQASQYQQGTEVTCWSSCDHAHSCQVQAASRQCPGLSGLRVRE